MDHQTIEDSDLVEAYVTGRLADTERTEFETHLVDCPACLDRVEATQGLAAGLRALGAAAFPVRTERRSTPVVPRQGMGARRLGRGAPGDRMGSRRPTAARADD